MKIKNIKINNYGNLENKDINLENKINIIYGKNESGKSTLLNYIKNIFYGISKNKNGKEISDYEKYKPWCKEDFSGKLKYELNNGEEFEIFRDFNKRDPKIFNSNMEDISKDFNIGKKVGSQFFYEHTKIDEAMFLSTIFSAQQEVKLDKQTQSVLVQKLANLAGTGDDKVSFDKAIDRLNKRQLEEIGTQRSQGKPINIVRNKLDSMMVDLKTINTIKEKREIISQEKEKIESEIRKLEIEKTITEEINAINLRNNIEKEKINFKNEINEKNKKKIIELNLEINKLIENKNKINKKIKENDFNSKENEIKNNKKNKNKISIILFFILLIIFVTIKIINNILIKNNLVNIFNYFLIPIYLIILFINNIIEKNKNKKLKYNNEIAQKIKQEKIKNELLIIETQIGNTNKQLEILQREEKENKEEIKIIQENIDNKFDEEIEKIKLNYLDKINIQDFLEYFDFSNSQKQLKNIEEKLNEYKLLLNSIEIEEKNIESKLENVMIMKEEYERLEEQLSELEEKSENIQLTKEFLTKAYEKMKNNITPKFTQNLSESIAEISNDKYNKVNINDTNGLIVENKYGEYIAVDRLSVGTVEQLYLSLRLSMIEEISEEKMPIILDEAFAYYDDIRLENVLRYLAGKLKEHQLIIFTCTKREQELLTKLGIPYNLVEL